MSNIITFPTLNVTAQSEIITPAPKANVFERRELPFSGIGHNITGNEKNASVEEIVQTYFPWELGMADVSVGGQVAQGWKGIVRTDTGKVFGITKDRYKPVQNTDAFGFVDVLREQGATLEKVGCYRDGEKVWFLMKLPSRSFAGDEHDLYMFLVNGNNGKQSLFVAYTTIRAMCCNMAHLVSKNATYKMSLTHRGDLEGKLLEAQQVMAGASQYFDGLAHTMDELRKVNLTREEMGKIIEGLFPYKDDDTERVKRTATEKRNQLTNILFNAPDLQNESMNGLRLIHALTDYESHAEPARHPEGFAENRLMNLVEKPMLADKVTQMILTA